MDDGLPGLQRELERELVLAGAGLPMGSLLEGRLMAAASRVLRRHGVPRFKVRVQQDHGELRVLIHCPPEVPRIQDVRLRTGF